MARDTEMARREERSVARPERNRPLEQLVEEMDRVFDDFGFSRAWPWARFGSSWPGMAQRSGERTAMNWSPDVEIIHRKDELVVRADLPGLSKGDIKVDVTEDQVTIQGERKHEQHDEHEGIYRSERSYGTFYRTIPLPPGTIADQAKANFHDGVLEITMPAPPESTRRRRLDITDKPAK